MLLDGSENENENENENAGTFLDGSDGDDWREIDGALQRIGKQRAALDAEEAGWLVRAARVQIWRELGFVSLLDYLERRCDYAPRTARDRIRVAFELEGLPALTAALAAGELGFSSVKELVRVVTPEHEAEWLAKARGKTCFEIQKLVAGRKKGSRPSDAPDPDLETRTLRFDDILPTTIARLREARAKAQAERGERLSDDALLSMLCGMFLDGAPTAKDTARAKYQIAVTVCEKCNQGWQDGAGDEVRDGSSRTRARRVRRATHRIARHQPAHAGQAGHPAERATPGLATRWSQVHRPVLPISGVPGASPYRRARGRRHARCREYLRALRWVSRGAPSRPAHDHGQGTARARGHARSRHGGPRGPTEQPARCPDPRSPTPLRQTRRIAAYVPIAQVLPPRRTCGARVARSGASTSVSRSTPGGTRPAARARVIAVVAGFGPRCVLEPIP
ncbi:MAG: hypothetical protein M3619_28365 [Myxococcota bacterium]|nr:hypothetical protein [Myxococcota bacterium]